MFKIRATQLEAYRLFRETDWMTAERFFSQLDGTQYETDEMLIGTEIHRLLELPDVAPDVFFDADAVAEMRAQLPAEGVAEAAGALEIETHGFGTVRLTGRADRISGVTVIDYKTSNKTADVQKYLASYQWRVYLLMFDCSRFVYQPIKWAINDCRIVPVVSEPVEQYRYSGMLDDVKRLATDFIATIISAGRTQNFCMEEPC